MGKKGTPHRKYSKEEKMRYVRLHLEDHISVRQIERDYGIGNALVSSWVKRYLQDGEDALEPLNGNPYAALHRSKSVSDEERQRLLLIVLPEISFIIQDGCFLTIWHINAAKLPGYVPKLESADTGHREKKASSMRTL